MTDDLLREASDPTTPGERLAALYRDCWKDDPGSAEEYQQRRALHGALVANPGLPLEELRWALDDRDAQFDLLVWHNPGVPLLLLREPHARFERMACHALRRLEVKVGLGRMNNLPMSLEAHVRAWAGLPVSSDATRHGRDFARHLAGLFGLPWPSHG